LNHFSRVFNYGLYTEIVFGLEAVKQLPEYINKLNGTKVFVISDRGIEEAGILDQVLEPLRTDDVTFAVFTDVDREPDVKTIEQCTAKAKEFGADLVIGVGGGSALDATKAVGVMVNNDGKIIEYKGLNNVPNPGIPSICIPTTSGTGSEVTIWTVISDKDKQGKFGIGGEYIAPTLALCDPNLTLSLPPSITAATGIDALTHALESFVNKATQPISEALSRQSMSLIASSVRKAVLQGDNVKARYDLLLGSTIAATAFNPTRLGLSHALCMPIGARFKVPHGITNAILLPQVMEFNLPGNLEKFKEIAEIFGENTEGLPLREAAELSVNAIKKLNEDVGIPSGFSEYGITEDDLQFIAEGAIGSDNVDVNPRKPTIEDLKEIVRKSL